MTVPAHWVLQFGGKLYNSVEIWACTLRFRGDADAFLGPSLDAVTADAVTDISRWVADAGSHLSTQVRLSYVKLNHVGTDGKQTGDNTNSVFLTPELLGSGGAVFPPQCATVVSLTTDATRGAAHRGRFYPPTLALGMTDTGRLQPLNCDDMATSAAQLISDLNNLPGADGPNDWRCVVASALPGGTGTLRDVTGVAVGDVVDTQRRRRNALVETYHAHTVTA